MALRRIVGVIAIGLCISVSVAAQKPLKRTLVYNGRTRTYLVFVPPDITEPAPLLMLLHGSGRDGASILDPWQSLARKEHIVLVAPDSSDRGGWILASDGPDFIKQIIDAVIPTAHIDTRRLYLFGHSAGGHQAINLALLESEYFAAAATHAGVLLEPELMLPMADRKIPIGLWSGLEDRVVPVELVRSTAATLKQQGFPVVLTEIPKQTHDYYGLAGPINAGVWDMLKTQRLAGDPKFKVYR